MDADYLRMGREPLRSVAVGIVGAGVSPSQMRGLEAAGSMACLTKTSDVTQRLHEAMAAL